MEDLARIIVCRVVTLLKNNLALSLGAPFKLA